MDLNREIILEIRLDMRYPCVATSYPLKRLILAFHLFLEVSFQYVYLLGFLKLLPSSILNSCPAHLNLVVAS